MLRNLTQECMHFLLQLLLQKMLACSLGHIWLHPQTICPLTTHPHEKGEKNLVSIHPHFQ
ncbi:hypothetical protein NC652_003259 [Populus alba x Populus x berolinensis]|nr:hypothetical protein NC652_003259 [Populus alba x Populus x berolinensis]